MQIGHMKAGSAKKFTAAALEALRGATHVVELPVAELGVDPRGRPPLVSVHVTAQKVRPAVYRVVGKLADGLVVIQDEVSADALRLVGKEEEPS